MVCLVIPVLSFKLQTLFLLGKDINTVQLFDEHKKHTHLTRGTKFYDFYKKSIDLAIAGSIAGGEHNH